MMFAEYFSEEAISGFFIPYAYDPMMVYMGVIAIMTASSLGLPIPEEVTLVSCGLIAYMARNPDQYPPPYPGAEGVDLYTLAIICFLAVILSDLLIFYLGKYFGRKIIEKPFFQNMIGEKNFAKIDKWFSKYGHYTCGIFRFTPGARFPGHMSCGMMGVPTYKFLLIDGTVALITVPTQVLLVAFYGEVILSKFKEFKLYLFGTLALIAIVYFIVKKINKKKITNS